MALELHLFCIKQSICIFHYFFLFLQEVLQVVTSLITEKTPGAPSSRSKHWRLSANWTASQEMASSSYSALVETNTQAFNTLRLRQNGRHFPDDIFKWISMNENFWISNKISLKYVPLGLIDNIATLIQTMAWRRSGDKSLSEPMLTCSSTHICVTWP